MPQFLASGLQPLDPSWTSATGSAAPSQRAVAAFDQNSYAVGDLVYETGASLGGLPVVLSGLPQVGPGGTSYGPVGNSGRRGQTKPLIVVAIAPASPGVVGPVLAGGAKAGNGVLWVIPAGGEFMVVGDGAAPSRGDRIGVNEAPLNLFDDFTQGVMFAKLAFGPPSGGMSGTALAGNSFTYSRGADVQVLGLASGLSLAAHSMYRVRFLNHI